jgi:hypothetical protein
LLPSQKKDLDLLHGILDGKPSVNGLIQTAVSQFIERKLREEPTRRMYEARAKTRLRVLR